MTTNARSLAEKARWVIRNVQSRRWLVLAVSGACAFVFGGAIFLVPQRFEASSKLFVDTQTVLKPMMVGLAYQPDIDQQVRMLARTLVSRPNVERLVNMPEVKFDFPDLASRDKVVTSLMEQIRIVAAERGNIYTISYRDSSPERALRLVQGTVALFVDTGAAGKRQDSVEARRFIDEQIHINETKLLEAESRLKDFKLRNFGVNGVSNQDYFARISAKTDEVNKLRSDLDAAERSRDAYRRELSGEDPQLPAESFPAAAPAATLEIDSRIDAQRKQLDDLLRRFTEDHPDVINARRLVATLESQRRQELQARASDPGGRLHGTAATSPVYQKIRVALAETEAQVASLRSQLGAQQGRLDQIRALAGRLPQVEAEFAQLNRDYDVIRKNFDQLVSRRESAALGVKLDESSQLAEFRVVEPPRVASTPVFPGRVHLALIAALVSILAGVGVALALDLLRPTIHDAASLEHLSGRPVLGTISLSRTDVANLAARRDLRRFSSAAAALATLQVAWLIWIAMRSSAI